MTQDEVSPGYRPVKDAHETLGLWSIRRSLTLAVTGAVVLLIAAWFLVSWLLGSPPQAKPKPLETKDQLELLKLVFALVAGVGALVALVTAYRRQRVDEAAGERAERIQAHAERVAREVAYDATERRVTDLYGQAVEQLGHDKAAVRLGGLYSLERLAQDHPEHRQTVTDVVCAYLRMAFQFPLPATPAQEPQAATAQDFAAEAARHELQVRLTAQRLLCRHLTIADCEHPASYWDGMVVDLTGAHLVDFDFTKCRPADANFTKAQFSGSAEFNGAKFSGPARFNMAEFGGDVGFVGAEFSGDVGFCGARFSGDAMFHQARFTMNIWFDRVEFGGNAWFARAEFSGGTGFKEAKFNGPAGFDGSQFDGPTGFDEAWFSRDVGFRGAQFSSSADFKGAQFGAAWFDDVKFNGSSRFNRVHFNGSARFNRAQFTGGVGFREARYQRDDYLQAVSVRRDCQVRRSSFQSRT